MASWFTAKGTSVPLNWYEGLAIDPWRADHWTT
jgi:hypothetical protein